MKKPVFIDTGRSWCIIDAERVSCVTVAEGNRKNEYRVWITFTDNNQDISLVDCSDDSVKHLLNVLEASSLPDQVDDMLESIEARREIDRR